MREKSKSSSTNRLTNLLIIVSIIGVILITLSPLLLPTIIIGSFTLIEDIIDQGQERKLEKALEERYGEDFEVVDSFVGSANWLNAGPLTGLCYPVANEKLLFKADYSLSNKKLEGDKYYEAIVREEAHKEMMEILSEHYTDFFLDVKVYKKGYGYIHEDFANVDEVSISNFEKKYGENFRLSFNIALNKNEVEKHEDVVEIFKNYSEKFTKSEISYYCYFASEDIIEGCREKKDEIKYISNDTYHLFSQMGTIESKTGIVIPNYSYSFAGGIFYLLEMDTETVYRRFDKG